MTRCDKVWPAPAGGRGRAITRLAFVLMFGMGAAQTLAGEEDASARGGPTFGPAGVDAVRAPGDETRGLRADKQISLPAEEQARLEARVRERWIALIERDFSAAYQYATPGFRAAYGPSDLALRYGRDVTWLRAEVAQVEARNPTSATVRVQVHYRIVEKPAMRDLEMHSIVEENWIRVENDWWFVPKT